MKKTYPSLIISIIIFLFSACATSSRLSDLDLGMNKRAVKEVMGDPLVRGAITNKYGQVVEVWEYTLWDSLTSSDRHVYWIYLVDGKLAQWGRAGDWGREATAIYEMRFR